MKMPKVSVQKRVEYKEKVYNFVRKFPGVGMVEISEGLNISREFVKSLIDNYGGIVGMTYRRTKGSAKRAGRRIFYVKR